MTVYSSNVTRGLMLAAAFTAVVSRSSLRDLSSVSPIGYRIGFVTPQRLWTSSNSGRGSRPIGQIGQQHNGASWEEISNPKSSKTVKLFKAIHKANKSRRNEIGLTVAEGVRLVADLLSTENEHSKSLVRRVVISDALKQRAESPDGDQYHRELIYRLREADKKSRASRDKANAIIINTGT